MSLFAPKSLWEIINFPSKTMGSIIQVGYFLWDVKNKKCIWIGPVFSWAFSYGKKPKSAMIFHGFNKNSTKIYPGNEHVPTQGMFEDIIFKKDGICWICLSFWRIPSLKLTWHLKMMVSNRNLLFQRSIFRCYVSFRECRHELLADFLSEDSVVCLRIGG